MLHFVRNDKNPQSGSEERKIYNSMEGVAPCEAKDGLPVCERVKKRTGCTVSELSEGTWICPRSAYRSRSEERKRSQSSKRFYRAGCE
ncbi:hypothetical protein [Geovibrio ferrireducens]|uniref:hypothetical protein n=1 Tax=Geovibrio ferrireducens TaxID=46201 RepID=UPI002247677F|nr:hypothetical protein [Geovibrio ferrireducens]